MSYSLALSTDIIAFTAGKHLQSERAYTVESGDHSRWKDGERERAIHWDSVQGIHGRENAYLEEVG